MIETILFYDNNTIYVEIIYILLKYILFIDQIL